MKTHDCAHSHKPNEVRAWVTRADGTEEFLGVSENLRTTEGADWQCDVMGNSTQPVEAQYIALTNDSGPPAAGHTTLASEIVANGLERAIGSYTHTNDTSSYKITKVFTATGAQSAQMAGLFNASSSGVMVFETLLSSPVTLATNDTLTIEWTVNV